MHKPWLILSPALVIMVVCVCGCISTAPPAATPAPAPTAIAQPSLSRSQLPASAGPFALAVDSLTPGSVLPAIYTCNGASESPPVSWLNVPAGTQSLVLLLEDPDAPAGTFTHWIVYNIPPETRGIPRSQPDTGTISNGAWQGKNSAGSTGYYPPCPPEGKSHRYVFTLYAVNTEISLQTANIPSISQALAGHTLGQAQFVTIYGR